jgi:hypothetical protein
MKKMVGSFLKGADTMKNTIVDLHQKIVDRNDNFMSSLFNPPLLETQHPQMRSEFEELETNLSNSCENSFVTGLVKTMQKVFNQIGQSYKSKISNGMKDILFFCENRCDNIVKPTHPSYLSPKKTAWEQAMADPQFKQSSCHLLCSTNFSFVKGTGAQEEVYKYVTEKSKSKWNYLSECMLNGNRLINLLFENIFMFDESAVKFYLF